MKNLRLLNLLLIFTLPFQGFAEEPLSPVRGFVTELAKESAPQALAHLKTGLTNHQDVGWKTTDEELVKKVLKELKAHNATITYAGEEFVIKVDGVTVKITLIDFLDRIVSVNGTYYAFTEEKSLREHIDSLSLRLKKKAAFNNPLIQDAHAIPLLFVIPAIIAASGAAVTIDAYFSQIVNELKNMDPGTQKKIKELTEKYTKRADICESDLENAKSSNTKGHIESLRSVRTIGELHRVLNTELYNKWFNGKSQIEYDKLSCSNLESKGIATGSMTGFWDGAGAILKPLCREQDRLNQCFASTEEVMRDQGIQINELRGPDRTGPFKDIYDEYREIKGVKK